MKYSGLQFITTMKMISSKQTNYKVSAGNVKKEASTEQPEIKKPASAPNKRKGMKKQIPSRQFLLFEDL